MPNTIELEKKRFTREELGDFVTQLLKADYIVVVDETTSYYTIESDYSPKLGFNEERFPRWINKDEQKIVDKYREDKYRETHEKEN